VPAGSKNRKGKKQAASEKRKLEIQTEIEVE
jgi:hypothetical protein